ncbi:PilW family protein [Silvimonas sp.]|uniref:PilW family protein n=1 Tax=Silvimonas sp. TaxID=2650811 RepID=UPI002847B0FC|nr:PilW family protein [Silvimonas sp.]MDR3429822.1 PilW family protein [Silvimonas sp.]
MNPNRKDTFSSVKTMRGFSMVELMVTLVIGLLVSLAIFSVLKISEGRKRTITSVNDIGQTGNYAMFQIDSLVRSAGSGFSGLPDATFGCTLNGMFNGTPATSIFGQTLASPFATLLANIGGAFRLSPVIIAKNASSAGSDVLIIMGGNSGMAEFPATLSIAPTNTSVSVGSTTGYGTNDIVLVTGQTSGNDRTNCYLEQVKTVSPTGLDFTNGNYSMNIPMSDSSLWDGAMVVNFGNIAKGNAPTMTLLGVGDNNTLYSYDLLKTNTLTAGNVELVADGIAEMHAVYGVDDGSGGITWVDPSGTYSAANLLNPPANTSSLLSSIKAIRIGLLTQSALPEKTAVSSGATVQMFSDLTPAGTPAPSYSRTLNGTEQNYRFRTIESTIPIRNVLNHIQLNGGKP